MFDAANVLFRRIEGDALRVVASAGPTVATIRAVLPDIPLERTDPCVRAFFENQQVPVEDRRIALQSERGEVARLLRQLPVGSQVFTPMSRQGKAIGVMVVTRSEVRPFQQDELELMKGFADQAVIAIENARLLSALRERTAEVVKLNQQLEQRVADQVGEIERMSRLRRFLPPQVADLIVASGTEKQLESHRREITALFCDLRGFTGFSESSDPEDVMALLAEYHAAIGTIIKISTAARLSVMPATASWLSSMTLSRSTIRRCKLS
jgi:GAF domain-containing protein